MKPGNVCLARLTFTTNTYNPLQVYPRPEVIIDGGVHEKKEDTVLTINGFINGIELSCSSAYVCKHCGCLFVE
jgi:hypothetical protein